MGAGAGGGACRPAAGGDPAFHRVPRRHRRERQSARRGPGTAEVPRVSGRDTRDAGEGPRAAGVTGLVLRIQEDGEFDARVADRCLCLDAVRRHAGGGADAGRHHPRQRQDRHRRRPLHHRRRRSRSAASASSRSAAMPRSSKLKGPQTRTIELAGRTVIPGLIDNHSHWVRAAEHNELRFDGVTSRKRAIAAARRARARVEAGRMDRRARRLVGGAVHRRGARLPASPSSTASRRTIRWCCSRSITTAISTARR